MKYGLLKLIILFIIHNVNGLKVSGKNSNISLIMQRIIDISDHHLFENKLPDITTNDNAYADQSPFYTVDRKPIGKIKRRAGAQPFVIIAKNIDKNLKIMDDEYLRTDPDIFTKDDTDNPKSANKNNNLIVLEDNLLHLIGRRSSELKEDDKEKILKELAKQQQEKKIKEIVEFMQGRYLTTNYLYNEVNRIKKQRKVKDTLRTMVEYLEQPHKTKLKAKVLRIYYALRKNDKSPVDIWANHKTNNLVINTIQDPYNDGYNN